LKQNRFKITDDSKKKFITKHIPFKDEEKMTKARKGRKLGEKANRCKKCNKKFRTPYLAKTHYEKECRMSLVETKGLVIRLDDPHLC